MYKIYINSCIVIGFIFFSCFSIKAESNYINVYEILFYNDSLCIQFNSQSFVLQIKTIKVTPPHHITFVPIFEESYKEEIVSYDTVLDTFCIKMKKDPLIKHATYHNQNKITIEVNKDITLTDKIQKQQNKLFCVEASNKVDNSNRVDNSKGEPDPSNKIVRNECRVDNSILKDQYIYSGVYVFDMHKVSTKYLLLIDGKNYFEIINQMESTHHSLNLDDLTIIIYGLDQKNNSQEISKHTNKTNIYLFDNQFERDKLCFISKLKKEFVSYKYFSIECLYTLLKKQHIIIKKKN